MSESQSEDKLSRREALKILAGSAGAVARLPILSHAAVARAAPLEQAAQSPPNLIARAPRFFNPYQLQTLDVLSETIIPADEHSPGAREARVALYIDSFIAESSEGLKNFWTEGLAALEQRAQLECGRKFTDCTPEQQAGLLQKVSENEEHPATLEERFFVALKRATVDGYYTSEIAIHKELEYQGNTALADFDGCPHDGHKAGSGE